MSQSIKGERGQSVLETAIVLVAFVVTTSVFLFPLLSNIIWFAEKQLSSINTESVPPTPSVIVGGMGTTVDDVTFIVALAAGGDPVDLTATAGSNTVVIGYRDDAQLVNEVVWTVEWIGANDGDDLLEEGELAEITVDLATLTTRLQANTAFTIEIKPPNGTVINVTRPSRL